MAFLRGTFVTPFGRELDPAEIVVQATDGVLDDAELDAGDLDALVVANAAAEGFTDVGNVSVWTATTAGLAGLPATRVDTGPSSGLAALWTARGLLSEPGVEHVLVLGWEAMTSLPTDRATRVLGGLMADDEKRAGLSLPGLVAILASAYLDRYDLDPGDLAKVPVKAHRLAASNPIAQFQREITVEDVTTSRMIADPLRLLHCAPLTDGAAAAVVSTDGPVRVDAMGHATDALGYTQRRTPPERFAATRHAARQLFGRAEHAPDDVDVVELHDAFSVLEAVNLEDLGLAAPGQGLAHVPDPEADPLAARPVVNPSGGLKARGHPIGATGLAQLAELFDQLTDRAANPVDGARIGLAHSIGGFGNNVHCALLEEAAP